MKKPGNFTNLEIFLVDDGSKDASGAIIDTYKDERIIVIHKENGGVSSARNIALDQATGDWILFVDGDDLFEVDSSTGEVFDGVVEEDDDVVEEVVEAAAKPARKRTSKKAAAEAEAVEE